MKSFRVHCPYCGAPAQLRTARSVYGPNALRPAQYLYVCQRWPACDAYVYADQRTRRPLGCLANGTLRHKRIEAHQALQAMQARSGLNKFEAYRMLQAQFGTPDGMLHIAQASEERCEEIITFCDHFMGSSGQRITAR